MSLLSEPEIKIFLSCYIVGVATTLFALWYEGWLLLQEKEYTITFGDGLTTFDKGKLTFVIDNSPQPSTHEDEAYLHIYGLAKSRNMTLVNISATDLTNPEGGYINMGNIHLFPEVIGLGNLTASYTPVGIAIDSIQAGTFNGRIMLLMNGNLTPIPLTAFTEPMLLLAILWILVGIMIAIATWEIRNYVIRKRTEGEERTKQEEELGRLQKKPADVIKAEMERNNMTQEQVEAKATLERHIALMQLATVRTKKEKLQKRLTEPRERRRTLFIEATSIVLGTLVASVALFNNAFVPALQVVGTREILVLIGLGLAIGSIKEIVDRK